MLTGVETVLEYDKIKVLLKKYTASQLGAARVEALMPSDDVTTVRQQQKLCSEAKTFHQFHGGIPLGGLKHIGSSLRHAAKVGSILDAEELIDIGKVARIPSDIHRAFAKRNRDDFPHLCSIIDALPTFPALVEAIADCISPDAEILDRASPTLRAIRRKLSSLRQNIHEKLEAMLRSPDYLKSVQEPVITSRNNRYVLPIKQEARTFFRGVVQGQSTSGATFFMEPLAIVEMNNALHEAAEAEHREIRRILLELADVVRENLEELEYALELLAELDFLNAKARFSLALNAVEPVLNTDGVVKLVDARHPLLEFHLKKATPPPNGQGGKPTPVRVVQGGEGQALALRVGGKPTPVRVVPTNIHIGKSFKTLVITGPNTGGKTVVLKTVGLLALMAQSGLHIPAAHGSQTAIFHQIFADIGDEQGIEQNLSTFSSHITKIAAMLDRLADADDTHSLVLLDEIGAGTDPSEGTALSMALLDWLAQHEVNTIVTTHYGALKAYAHAQPQMENASMEFDWTTLRPTYRVQVGVPGSSNAIKIAAQLGIRAEVLDEAQTHLGNNNVAVEELLVELQQQKDDLETERVRLQEKIRDAEKTTQKHEQLVQNFETERKILKEKAETEAMDIVSNARRTVEKLIADIRRENASKASIQQAFSQIETAKKQLKPKPKPQRKKRQNFATPKVSVGDKVRIKKLNRFGEVTSIAPKSSSPLKIVVGNMHIQVAYAEIDQVQPKSQVANISASVLDIQHDKASTVQSELNIRGMLVHEALDITDKYLDDAYLANMSTARILHGKGTGALRNAVHEELRHNPRVTKYQFAPQSQGGEGVTVVTFKD